MIERLPHVEGVLNYLAPMAEKPMNLAYDPPPGVAALDRRSGTASDDDLRCSACGGASVARRRRVWPWSSTAARSRTSMTRTSCAASIIRGRTPRRGSYRRQPGAGVRPHDPPSRLGRRRSGAGTPRQPVTSVHNDYTVKSGPQRVRDLMGEEAEELLRHRFEIVNVWRPIRGPLRDAPLAVCDATSVAFADFVPSDLVYRDRTRRDLSRQVQPGAPLVLRAGDAHRRGGPDQMLRLWPKTAGRALPRTRPFEDPTAPADVLPRESIELRTLIFHTA